MFSANETDFIIAAWFLVPFVILSIGVNKDIRFLLPILPVIGLVTARLFFRAVPKRAALPALLFCAIPIFNFFNTTFPISDRSIYIAEFPLISYQWENQVRRPIKENWRLDDILGDINRDAGDKEPAVTMVVDHQFINAATFDFYRNLYKYHMRLGTIAYLPGDEPVSDIVNGLSGADYIVTKTGFQGQPGSNAKNVEVKQLLLSDQSEFYVLKEYQLPDASMAVVLKHKQ